MIESMKTTPKYDRRIEGLRELAGMIADAYRKGKTFHNNGEKPLVSEGEIIVGCELDGENGYKYTETVRVEVFLRRKGHVNNNVQRSSS